MLTVNRRGLTGIRRCVRAGRLASLLALLLTALATSAGAEASAAPEPARGGTAQLEHLASTLGNLKASLSAIREDLAAMHETIDARDAAATTSAGFCAEPVAAQGEGQVALARELAEARARAAAEGAAREHAEVAMTGELNGLRERLAASDAAVAKLRQDRQSLVKRITELDEIVQKARTSELVDALVEEKPAASLMRVTQPALAAEAPPAFKASGSAPLARVSSRLDLQAELALAQLRIAELSNQLESARVREEAMQAEVTSLRSLTDAQIRRFMGRD